MARQENQARQAAWIIGRDIATPKRLLKFAQELKSGALSKASATVTVALNGTRDGTNFTGDPDEVLSELQAETESAFVNATAKAQFPNQGNAQGTVSINFAIRQLTVNLQKGASEFASQFFELVWSRFPPEEDLDEEQEESLSLRLSRLIREAESAVSSASEAKEAAQGTVAAKDRSLKAAEALQKRLKEAEAAAGNCAQHQEQSSKHAADISNAKGQVQADQEAARAAREQIGALEAQIQQFHDEIEANRKRIVATEEKASDTVERNESATKVLIEQNEALQDEIKEHLQKAVGASLFSAFQKRKDQISGSKWIWAGLVTIAIAAQAGIFIWLATSLSATGSSQPFYARPGFVLRALASIPIIFFIGYAIRQYARERDFEELYAFKAALSFSLAPYLDLVKTLSESAETEAYRDFAVRTIGQVFENPRHEEAVKSGSRRESVLVRDVLDRVIDLMEKAKK